MQNQASMVAGESMAGEVQPHQKGQDLHFGKVYDQPVICPRGRIATQTIIDLQEGDKVSVSNIPYSLCERHNIARKSFAVRVGGFNSPGFKFLNETGAEVAVISYRELYSAQESDEILIHVESIRD